VKSGPTAKLIWSPRAASSPSMVYDYGFAGHFTVRDPEFPNLYWTNPMCVHFADVSLSSLILADHEGTVQEGRYAINRAGFVLHAAVHEHNPKVIAMCHAHTPYGVA
jgi:ribulose-5-phosphate 4-epimerase/fuculose-1-phosphate aldolase